MRISLLYLTYYSLSLAAAASDGHHHFADQLALQLQTNQNDCTSALSLSMAMSLIYPIMEGNSKTQVETVFGYDSSNDSIWVNASQQINSENPGACLDSDCALKGPTVFIANSVWVDANSTGTVNPILTQFLDADELFAIDFSDATAGDQVNAWVNTTTQGLIEDIVKSGPLSKYVVLALNSIYLKVSWASPFLFEDTNQDAFYASPDRATVVSDTALFLHQVAEHPYSHEAIAGYQVLQLPFFGGSLSMVLVLPLDDDAGAADSTAGVNSTTVLDALPRLSSQRVALAIPKFQFESTYEDKLTAALRALGVTDLFAGGLCIYENDCSAAIDLVIQKTFISIDEEGVEAAAVTALSFKSNLPLSVPTLFLADHPFQFFIYDDITELVLFEGRVGDPEPQADAPAVSLLDNHTKTDFWDANFGVLPTVVRGRNSTVGTTTTPAPAAAAVADGTAEPTTAPIMASAPVAFAPVTPNIGILSAEPTQSPLAATSWATTHATAVRVSLALIALQAFLITQ